MKRFLLAAILALPILLETPSGVLAAPDAAPAVSAPASEATPPPGETKPAPSEAKSPEVETKSTPSETPPTGETQSWWQALLVDVISASLAIFVPVLSTLLFLLLRKLGLKVELSTLDQLAGKAALYAEQKAAAALKEGKPKTPGAEKERWAWELVESIDAKLGGSDKARAKLRALILAKIPEATAAVSAANPPKNGA